MHKGMVQSKFLFRRELSLPAVKTMMTFHNSPNQDFVIGVGWRCFKLKRVNMIGWSA